MDQLPSNMTIELSDADVHSDLIKIVDAMEAIRRQNIVDKEIDGASKNEYLRLASRLATIFRDQLDVKGDDLARKLIDETVGEPKLLNYDYSGDEEFRKSKPNFAKSIDLVTIACMGDDFRGFGDNHHFYNAVKIAGSQSRDLNDRFPIFDSVLPVNGNVLPDVKADSSSKKMQTADEKLDLKPENFVYLPKSEVYVTKRPILKGLNWDDSHKELMKLGLKMVNLEVFIDYWRLNKKPSYRNGSGKVVKNELENRIIGGAGFSTWIDVIIESIKDNDQSLVFTDHIIEDGEIRSNRTYRSNIYSGDITTKNGRIVSNAAGPYLSMNYARNGALYYGVSNTYDYGCELVEDIRPISKSRNSKNRGALAYIGKDDFERTIGNSVSKPKSKGNISKDTGNLHPDLEELASLKIDEVTERSLVWSFGNHHTQGDRFYDAIKKESGLNMPNKYLAREADGMILHNEIKYGDYRKVHAFAAFNGGERYALTYIGRGENSADMQTLALILSQKGTTEEKIAELANHTGSVYAHVSKYEKGEKVGDVTAINLEVGR